ncbi:MAG: hypothetical protein IPL39_13495 [Opitutaceae bacterium]|nr:hypothetical protein [Opitutaceae bacterium]
MLKTDLALLRERAFHHFSRCSMRVRGILKLRRKIDGRSDSNLIWRVYDWLLVPLSMWPIDIDGLAGHVADEIDGGRVLDEDLRLLIWFLGDPPTAEAQRAVGAFEHEVESGQYEKLLRQPEKFREREAVLEGDSDLARAWTRIKQSYEPTRYQNKRGVIRRRMSEERNFRRGWTFKWKAKKDRFLALFDAMCYRWCLYGMEGDKPLGMKLSVNPTPYGTLIMIPGRWSLDCRRDVDWKMIGRLHRAHGAARQGPKLSMAHVEMHQEGIRAEALCREGRLAGLRGERLTDYVLDEMGKDPGTDPSWLKRRLKLIRKPTA